MDKIKVYVKRVGEEAELCEIENTLEALQRTVDGYIETVTLGDVVVICDEEGRLKGKPHNCRYRSIPFCGTIIFAGIDEDEGEFADYPRSGVVIE